MNEVLAVLYICFRGIAPINEQDQVKKLERSTNKNIIEEKYIESDLFVAFTNVMVDMRDGFLRELDKEPSGMQGHINNYKNILSYLDPELHDVIEGNQIPH